MRYSEMPHEPTEEGERRKSFSLDPVEKGKSNVLHASQSKPRTTLARLAEERKSSVHEWMDLSDWPEKVKQVQVNVRSLWLKQQMVECIARIPRQECSKVSRLEIRRRNHSKGHKILIDTIDIRNIK